MATIEPAFGGTTGGTDEARRRQAAQRRREWRRIGTGFAFISPWLVGFLAFQAYPFFASLYYSFRSTTLLRPGEYIGLDNYRYMLDDELFWISLKNTFYYLSCSIALGTAASLGLALLLNQRVRGISFYRTIFYLPTIVPLAAVAVIWGWILNPRYGILNYALEGLGLPTVGWFSDPTWAMPGLIFVGLWGIGNAVIIYLAGLQDIPVELYEAAELDGASGWQKSIGVTLPLLTPVILFNVAVSLIGGFQYFVEPYVLTGGGPADATLTYALYLYQSAFEYRNAGYASAMAWVLFVIIMTFTMLLLRSSRRWVHYQG